MRVLLILVKLEFGDVGFCMGRKTGEPDEKPLEQGENQQQTQPIYGTGPESNLGRIWWEGSALTTAPSLLPRTKLCVFLVNLQETEKELDLARSMKEESEVSPSR